MIARRAGTPSTPIVAAVPLRRAASAQSARWPSLAGVWRDALNAFAMHGPSVLVLSVIGFAGAALIGLSVSQAMSHDDVGATYFHASGPLASHEGLNKLSPSADNGLFALLLAQSLFGLLLTAFARGAITHLALSNSDWRAACHVALKRLPGLVAGMLIYSAMIGFGAVSVNTWLITVGYDLSDAGQKVVTVDGAQQLTLLRSFDALVPNPGSPVSEFVPYLRHTAFRHLEPVVDYNQKLLDDYGGAATGVGPLISSSPERSGETHIWMLASVMAFVTGSVLLRFWAVMMMQSSGLIAPLAHSVGWGMRHFSVIAVHACALRLVMWAFGVIFVVTPIVIAQCFGGDVLIKLGLPRDLISPPAMIAGAALVNSVCVAFGAVYDARLYRMLR